MICPLLSVGGYANPHDETSVACAEEECAWWGEKEKKCAVVMLTSGVDLIGGVLMDDIRGALKTIGRAI